MKTTDSVMREKDFENKKNKAIRESTIRDILRDNPPYEYYDIDGKIHILSNLQNTTKLVAEKLESFLSHSLAEARRDERTKILDGIDRWIGNSGYPLHDCEYGKCHSNTKELIKHLRSDLLTGDNPEEDK